jgi:histidyl-tRNA synthetase
MALRYDLTAPLARFAAEHWDSLPKPFRRYAFGPVWRNEKPGPGRDRQFIQCDADTVGSARPEADAEIIAMAVAGYAAAGLPADVYLLKINNRKLLNGLLTAAGVENAGQKLAVLRAVDKLDRLGADGVAALLGEGRRDESGAFTKGAGLASRAIASVLAFVEARRDSRVATLDRLSEVIGGSVEGDEGLAELSQIGEALDGLGVGETMAVFDPSVVRGLEYYTGAVFEAELTLPTVNERVGAARGPVVVIAFDAARMSEYFTLAAELRTAGVAAEVYLGGSGMRAQMKYADRRLSPAAVILGEDEIAAGTVTIKDLDLGRELSRQVTDNSQWREGRPGQQTIPRAGVVADIRAIIGGGQ